MIIYAVRQLFNLYVAVLAMRLVSMWLSLPLPKALASGLSLVADPYLNLFRGILPMVAGIDIGLVFAVLLMGAIQVLACFTLKNLFSK